MEKELKLGVTTDEAKIDKASEKLKTLASALKIIELRTREGKLTADQYSKALSGIINETNKLEVSLKQSAQTQMAYFLSQQRIENNFKSMSGSLATMDKRMSTANQTLISFSQGMQDSAQFSMGLQQGLRGVANNIQQVAQMGALLYKETGSVGGAFSLMIKQLNSPAGLLVALAAVTSAIQIIPTLFKDAATASKEALDQMTKDAQLFSKYGFGFNVSENMGSAKKSISDKIRSLTSISPSEAEGLTEQQRSNRLNQRLADNKSEVAMLRADLALITEFEKTNSEILKQERERSQLNGLINKYTGGTLDTLEKMDALSKKKGGRGSSDSGSTRWSGDYQFGSMFGDIGDLSGGQPSAYRNSFMYEAGAGDAKVNPMRKSQTAREYLDEQEKAWKDFYDRKEQMMKDDADATDQNLRRASELYNSVFFSPLKAGFDAIANGSQNMAKAVGDAIKKMLIQLAEFAAAAGILSLFGFGGFMPIFGQLAGIGKLPMPVTNKPMTLDTGRTADLMSANTSGRVIQIVGETKLKDDYVLIQYKRANALKNSSRA